MVKLKILNAVAIMAIAASTVHAATSLEDLEPPIDPEYDWIQLTSGEWLKGDLKVMYDDVIEFESEELDLLEFDLEDVKQLRTRDEQAVLLETGRWTLKNSIVHGQLTLSEDKVLITNGGIEQEYKRGQLIAMAADVERERDYWSGSVSLGITARGGNTETVDATAMANIKRRKASSRFIADYIGNYSSAATIETAKNHRLTGAFDRYLTTLFFWRIIGLQYYRDPFSNIDHQYSIESALGCELINNKRVTWAVAAGAGYQFQEFVSVAAPKDTKEDSPFILGATLLDAEVTKSVDFRAEYSFRILNEVSGTYTHHALAKVSTEFIGDLDIDISLIWDYINTPQQRDDGTFPEKDDYQLVFSLAYDL